MVGFINAISSVYSVASTGAGAIRAVGGVVSDTKDFCYLSNADKYDLVMKHATKQNIFYGSLISTAVTAALANPVSRAALFSMIGVSYSLTFLTAQLLIMGLYFAATTGVQTVGTAASLAIGGAQMAMSTASGLTSIIGNLKNGAKAGAPALSATVQNVIEEVRANQALEETFGKVAAKLTDEQAAQLDQVFEGLRELNAETLGQPVVPMAQPEIREVLNSQSQTGSVVVPTMSDKEIDDFINELLEQESAIPQVASQVKPGAVKMDDLITEFLAEMPDEQMDAIFEARPQPTAVNKQAVAVAAKLDVVFERAWDEVNASSLVSNQALDAVWDQTSSAPQVAAQRTGSSLNPAKMVKVGFGLYAGYKLARQGFKLFGDWAERVEKDGEEMVKEAEKRCAVSTDVSEFPDARYEDQPTSYSSGSYSFV